MKETLLILKWPKSLQATQEQHDHRSGETIHALSVYYYILSSHGCWLCVHSSLEVVILTEEP